MTNRSNSIGLHGSGRVRRRIRTLAAVTTLIGGLLTGVATSGRLPFGAASATASAAAPTLDVICDVAGARTPHDVNLAVPAAQSGLRYVSATAVDSQGRLYFHDYTRNGLYRMSDTGMIETLTGPVGQGPVYSMVINRTSDTLYLAIGQSVWRMNLNPLGAPVRIIGNGTLGDPFTGNPAIATVAASVSQWGTVHGLALAPDGDLIVSSYSPSPRHSFLARVPAAGGIAVRIAGLAHLPAGNPTTGVPAQDSIFPQLPRAALAVDGAGNLYHGSGTGVFRIPGALPTGLTTRVAGLTTVDGPDGGLATAAGLGHASAMAWQPGGPSGAILVAVGSETSFGSGSGDRIRRIDLTSGVITRFAGTGVRGFGGDGGDPTAAGVMLAYPTGISVAPSGDVYFSDSFNYRIRRITAGTTPQITTVAGNDPGVAAGIPGRALGARLSVPQGLAYGPDGSLYIGGGVDRRIYRVKDGQITTVAGNGVAAAIQQAFSGPALNAPIGVTSSLDVAADGSILVSLNLANPGVDDAGQTLVRIEANGNITHLIGTGSNNTSTAVADTPGPISALTQMNGIADVENDEHGNAYWAEPGFGRVRQLTPGRALRTVAGSGGNAPWTDASEGLLATAVPLVQAVDANGRATLSVTSLVYDHDGNLFIGVGYGVVMVEAGTGLIRRVIGHPAQASPASPLPTGVGGPARDARLGEVASLEMAEDGTLYGWAGSVGFRVVPGISGTTAQRYATARLEQLIAETATGSTANGVAVGAATVDASIVGDIAVDPTTGYPAVTDADFSGIPTSASEQAFTGRIRRLVPGGCAELKVSSSVGSILASGSGVPLSALSGSQLPRGGGIYALAKLRSADLRATGASASPLADIPLADIPLADIPLADIPLADIPLADIAGGWSTLLIGTKYEGFPVQSVTLKQVLTLNNPTINAVKIGQVDLQSSPLADISVAALALGRTPLADIPLPGHEGEANGVAWCAEIAETGRTCDQLGIKTASDTILALELMGVPLADIAFGSTPLADIPLADIPLADIPLADIPLADIPLADIPLADIDLDVSPLADIPLADIPLADIGCPTTGCTGTLGQAAAAGMLRPGLTLGDLVGHFGAITVGQFRNGLPDTVTLDDILVGLVSRSDLPWESWPLARMGLTSAGVIGQNVSTYSASFTIYPDAPTTAQTLTFTLPPGFDYRTGSTSLTVTPYTGPAVVTATEPSPSGQTLTWSIPNGATLPADVTLTFGVRSGSTAGASLASATVTATVAGAATMTTSNTVTVTDPGEPGNDTPATAEPVTKDVLYLGAVGAAADLDFYRVPVPPKGVKTRVLLSHLAIDADVVVYESAAPPSLRTTSGALRPTQSGPETEILAPQLLLSGQPLEPQTLQDVPMSGDPTLFLKAASAKRSTNTEAIELTSRGQGGNYTIQVSGYNGATSTNPYLLRVKEGATPGTTNCAPRNATPGVSPTVLSLTPGTKSVFLVNEQRMLAAHGVAATGTMMSKLTALAGRPEVSGTVIRVEHNAAVQSAYASWDAQPCDPDSANAVVARINDLVDTIAPPESPARGALKFVVLVGSDDMVPMARVADDATLSNEADYASDLTGAGNSSNALSSAAGNRFTLSDDPYGDFTPTVFGNRALYLPDVALGRLVETPGEISGVIDQYVASNGRLDASTTLTTGYDFLTDGADEINTRLGLRQDGTALSRVRSILTTPGWDKTALIGQLYPNGASPQIASINAHFDHYQALPASGNATGDRTDLFTTAAVADTTRVGRLAGRLVFSIGCHSGLSVPDGYVAAGAKTLDWPQAFAQQKAVYIGNTGFGYGDTDLVAYSEKLAVLFAARLDQSATAGEALRLAKGAYAAGGLTEVYDIKVLAQMTFYGLPMFQVGVPTNPPALPPVVTPTPDPLIGGIQASSFNVQPSFSVHTPSTTTPPTTTPTNTQSPLYLSADSKSPLVADGRPIEPRTDLEVTAAPGTVAHGALITALQSSDQSFTVAIARPTVDLSANEPDRIAADAAWPSTLTNVTSYPAADRQRQRLVLAVGQWFPDNDPLTPGNVGTQRRFTRIEGRVLYRPASDTDFVAPVISEATAQISGTQVTFNVRAADPNGNTIVRATVIYRDGTTWRSVDLAATGSGSYTKTDTVSTNRIDYIVQVVDASGNVGTSANKALNFEASTVGGGGGGPTPPRVVPFVCRTEPGNRWKFVFGYTNATAAAVKVLRGPDNFLAGSTNKKPPEDFAVGTDPRAIVVVVPQGTTTSWHINGVVADGYGGTPPCAPGVSDD